MNNQPLFIAATVVLSVWALGMTIAGQVSVGQALGEVAIAMACLAEATRRQQK